MTRKSQRQTHQGMRKRIIDAKIKEEKNELVNDSKTRSHISSNENEHENENVNKIQYQSNELLPLNSDVVKRIRLNIGTGLPSSAPSSVPSSAPSSVPSSAPSSSLTTQTENTKKVDNDILEIEQVPSPLQNTMKSKLADVLKSKSNKDVQKTQRKSKKSFDNNILNNNNNNNNDTLLVLNESWSSIDCIYQDLIKTQKRNTKSPTKVTFESNLFDQFDNKMNELREMFHKINQTLHKKRPMSQNSKQKKKIKVN